MSSARWIWSPRREYVNQHIFFRKRFELAQVPASVVLKITADTRYCLYVNGEGAFRGPARSFPHAIACDEIDIAPLLKPGPNVLAVHVLSFGVSTGISVFRDRAGLYVQCEIPAGSGVLELETNHTWRFSEAPLYRRQVSRSASQLGYQEHLDYTRDSFVGEGGKPDWRHADFDDSAWQKPHLLGIAGVLPWRALRPRGIPALESALRLPLRITGQWEGADRLATASTEESCDVACTAALEKRTPASRIWFDNADSLRETPHAKVQIVPTPAGQASALVIDFGETRFGYPVLKIDGAHGGEIFDLIYDERLGESGIDITRPCNGQAAAYEYSLGDRLTCRAGANTLETLQPRGFRYLMLIARNVRKPVTLSRLALHEVTYPVAERGSFACSDKLLNTIWATGVRTLRHCMADAYMDCPKTQEQGWASARIAGMVSFYALGDTALYRAGLQLMAQSSVYVPDGLLMGVNPSERPDCVMLDYCLHWIASLWEYYLFTGDISVLKEHRGTLEKVLSFFSIHAGERGLLGPTTNYSIFLDNAPGLDRGNLSATFNLLYLQALRAAAQIGNALGDSGLASHCSRNAVALADRIMMVFSSSRRSLLVETVDMRTGEPGDLVSQHATALAVLEGVLGRRDYDRTGAVADVVKDFLPAPGVEIALGPVRANLFFRGYVHEALSMLGHGRYALEDIRRTWGYMLDQGATTWWERLPMRPGSSRCQAWSSHPTTFLSRHVLGLAPLEPGWKAFRVSPQAFDLTHAEGKVPTPHGEISVRWEKQDGNRIKLELTAPSGTEARYWGTDKRQTQVLTNGTHTLEA
ncbi:MAG TPA: alpha-L-rhamnosidase C-terminal domain-containing protein [Planctomycetota bacterium]|nr:alpha-L-rhamnosidase C-terminal domain-containing protein [Planctomycetota bacterium]